jgi:hypothetical protein
MSFGWVFSIRANEKLYDIVFKVAERTVTRVSSPNCPFGTVSHARGKGKIRYYNT